MAYSPRAQHAHAFNIHPQHLQQPQRPALSHQPSSEVSYFDDNDEDDVQPQDSSPLKPVRRGGNKSRKSTANKTRAGPARKKINAVSQSSLATFHPGYMGMEAEMEPSWSQSSAGSSYTADVWSPTGPNADALSPPCQGSPTPELEAFLVTDMETALTQTRRDSQDDFDDNDGWGHSSKGAGHRRAGTMASVFEDDADASDVSAANSKVSHARRVAFKMRTPSTDSTKAFSPSKQNKSLPSGTASPLARFFNWRKTGKSKNGNGNGSGGAGAPFDDSVPSSAPPHVTTFAESCRSPGLETDFGSEGVGGGNSLPNTPLSHLVALPGSPNVMPHRRPGPPPRSILRKQSAPALRSSESTEREDAAAAAAAAWPLRSFEAPASFSNRKDVNSKRRNPPTALLGLSTSTDSQLSSSSSTDRVYSTVGRGVARDRSSSFSSVSSAGGQKSPKRKQANRRFEGIPSSPSPQSAAMLLHSPPTRPVRLTGQEGISSVDSVPRLPMLPCLSSSMSMSMGHQVADGLLSNSRGFEEPAPRTQPSSQNSLTVEHAMPTKTLRRRSRSVGALDVQETLSSAYAEFADQAAEIQTQLAPSRAMGVDRGPTRSLDPKEATRVTPEQRSPPKSTSPERTAATSSPRPSAHHKASDSVQSSSDSDSGDSSTEIHTVQARRVQLVTTRVKATTVSSPSLASVTKSPRIGDSSPSLRNAGSPSSPQASVAGASPLLAAPRFVGTAPSTPQRTAISSARSPASISPASTLGLTEDDEHAGKRNTFLLARSFAELEVNEGVARNESTLDFGFPPCPPVAPLNIKPRERLVSNFSESSDVSLSSSLGSVDDSDLSEAESTASLQNGFSYPESGRSQFSTAGAGRSNAPRPAVPQILTFASNGSMDSTVSGSLPSLTSSDSEMSDPPLSRPGGLTVTASASSTSLSSMLTTNTSILDLGMPHEEAQRYVHRAQLSEDAFTDRNIEQEGEDQRTPTLSSGAFKPAIHVIGPDTYDARGKPQLTLDFEPGGSLGLSLGPMGVQGRRGSNASSRRSSRTVTPTQGMYRASSPLGQQKSDSGYSSPSKAGLGLGLGFGLGCNFEQPMSPAEQPVMQFSPHVGMGEKADFGHGAWEDYEEKRPQYYDEGPSELSYCQDEGQEWEMGVAM